MRYRVQARTRKCVNHFQWLVMADLEELIGPGDQGEGAKAAGLQGDACGSP